jgi:GT2 family glycosyltransferase
MLNSLRKIRDYFFPPSSKRRYIYEIFRKSWLRLRKHGPKAVYQDIRWRVSKPRRMYTPEATEPTSWIKVNPLLDNALYSNIEEIPLTEKVDIVICVGPNHSHIIPCLSSIEKFTKEEAYNLYLVVHQNDVAKLPDNILTTKVNLVTHEMKLFNYSRANNLVLKQSTNDVVLLNDDTEVTENWLEQLRRDSKGVALTGAHTEVQRSGNPQMWGQGPATLTNYPINMFCAYIPFRVHSVIGLLNEEFCYYGGEDVDYSCRVLMNGFPLMISSAFVNHKDNQSFKASKDVLIKESDLLLLELYGIEAPFDLSKIKPKVSVIMATRNRPELLKAAMDSVLQIDFDNFEIIIVDDYSNAETNETIYKVQQKDDRILAIRLPRNLGSSKARRVGLKAAHGQFVFFTDDDDTVFPNRISKPLEHMILHPKLDVVYCNYNLVSDDGSITPTYNQEFEMNAYLDLKFTIGLGILLGRKNTFIDVPFMSVYDKAVDYDWVFRLIRRGYKIDLCPEIVMNYNRTGAPRYHLSGNMKSIDVHDKVYQRESLLKKVARKD